MIRPAVEAVGATMEAERVARVAYQRRPDRQSRGDWDLALAQFQRAAVDAMPSLLARIKELEAALAQGGGDGPSAKVDEGELVAVIWRDGQGRRCTTFGTGQELGSALHAARFPAPASGA
jgi:hypothetical protein